jgi:NodT family efflux transporter outer membrane factor (OMF) lipoprotein
MKRFPALLLASTAAVLLAGCANVPDAEPQLHPLTSQELGLPAAGTAAIADTWWKAFNDPQLDRLIAQGLENNPNLAGALARVRAAEASIGASRAVRLPQVDADAQLLRQRYSENYFLPPPLAGSTYWIPQLEAGLHWDLDLFGRTRAAITGAEAQAKAARLDAAAARLSLSTAIAKAYIGLARAEKEIGVTAGFVETRQQALSLIQTNLKNQLASQFDLQQAKTLLAEAEQARNRALEERDVMIHALAALVGQGPGFYAGIAPPQLALEAPPPVPQALPADLLGRRPDLLAGQARIEAVTAGRQAAKAQFLPNISIEALAGTVAFGIGNVFKAGSLQYDAGPAIHLPVFEGGKLKAQYKGATAMLDEAVASYDGAVVAALRQAANAMTGVSAADRDLADQQRIVAGLRETVRLDQVRIATGLGSRLDAIDSGFRLLEAEQALVDLEAEALTRRVSLIAALGGGFDPHSLVEAAATQRPDHAVQ